jgi:hypothetical protein
MTPLLSTGLLMGGLLLVTPAAAPEAESTLVDLPLASVSDDIYLVEAAVYDGTSNTGTLTDDPRPLLAPEPLLVGPLLAGRITAATDQGVATHRWSDRGWTSAPDDTLANVHFHGRATQPLALQWALPLSPEDEAQAAVAAEVSIENRDGGDDRTAEFGVDGRVVVVKRGARTDAYADFATVFSGYGVTWQLSGDQLHLALRERGHALAVPLTARYGGTGGADGTAEIEGRPIPALYGICRNVTPVLVVPASLIFQVHFGRIFAVSAVYDRGVALVFDADYANYAALAAATIAGGKYGTCLAEGTFRLGSSPSFPVTADVQGDATVAVADGGGYVGSPVLIAKRILLDRGGLALAELDVDAMDATFAVSAGASGMYFTDSVTVEEAISAVCRGAFLRWGQNRDGTIGIWRIAPPSNPAFIIGIAHMLEDPSVLPLPESVDPCLWRVTAGYQRNWTPMTDADIAGSVGAAQRQFLRQQWRRVIEADTDRLARNLLARQIELPTMYDQENVASTLALNLLTLFDQGRRLIEITIPAGAHSLGLRDVEQLVHPRFGLAGGVAMRVISLREDCGARTVSAVLFG